MYNPFNKDISELDRSDLQLLIDNEIAEGWYIEYKSKVPETSSGKLDNLKIVKSLSSFANTKGGWIFWGVECDKNAATKIVGFDISSYDNFQDQVSRIISSNVNPLPIYHFREISIDTNCIVFIIQVEESPTPPYITSQGVIYQRENNESKPVKERYILEKLKEKTDLYIQGIEDFCHIDLAETRGQADSDQPYLELYLYPIPFNGYYFTDFYESDFFEYLSSVFYDNSVTINENNLSLGMNFNSILCSNGSIIIRSLNKNNLIYKGMTVELFANGGLKFLCPLSTFSLNSVPKYYENSAIIDYLRNEYDAYSTDLETHMKMIDGTDIIYTIMILITKYQKILQHFGCQLDLRYRAKLTGMWRKFVFIDSANYLEKIKLYNIPCSPKDEIEMPQFANGYSYELIKDDFSFLFLAKDILLGIGLPNAASVDIIEAFQKGIKKYENRFTVSE
jgi:hypothetical protein